MGNYDNVRWNTHGLWPNTMLQTSCGYIFTCTDEEYDESKLTVATKTLIDVTWNGMYSDTFTFRKYIYIYNIYLGMNGKNMEHVILIVYLKMVICLKLAI